MIMVCGCRSVSHLDRIADGNVYTTEINEDNLNISFQGEGLQLMNLMLREKKMSRGPALKVLSYAMNGPEGKDNCNKFVDILGLRTVYPLFMKTPKSCK